MLNLGLFFFLFTKNLYAAEIAKLGDGTTITTEEFSSALKAMGPQGERVAANPEMRKRFLDHMINSKLIAKLAKEKGFEKDAKFQKRLKDVTEQLLAGEYMDRQIEQQDTEAAQKKYFEEHKQEFSKKEIKASHALFKTEDEAKKFLQDVQKPGTDFDALAKKVSTDKSVDLGFFGRGRMVPEFDKAAFATPPNTIHPSVVKTSFGWHVIKVTGSRGDDKTNYADVKEDVKRKFRQTLQENLVHDVRDKAKVVVLDEPLKNFKMP